MIYILNDGTSIRIDKEDLPLLERYNWQSNYGYIFRSKQTNLERTRYYLHREIMSAPEDKVVDHINGDPTDNRRSNLRICSQKENAQNKRKTKTRTLSVYKGVKPRLGKFEASIGRRDSYEYIGTYETEIEAAIAYNRRAIEKFGEFARLNEIPQECKDVVPRKFEGSSSYRGDMFHKRVGKWQAAIQHNKKRIHIGYFDNEEEAALAYNEMAKELRGAKAKLNVIEAIRERLLPYL